MPNDRLLTRADVRDWTEERFVERGRRYYAEERIQHPRRQDNRLRADCQGSQPTPYRVEAMLDDTGIASARCSCPMGAGGRCKHVVALLLTWIDEPERFTEEKTLNAQLRTKTRDQLIRLIKRMVDRYPDLEMMVSLAAGGASDFDVEVFRKRVEQVFSDSGHYDYRYEYGYGGYGVARDLEPFVQRGDDYAEADHRFEASQAYRITAEVILDHYEQFADEGGELAAVATTCAERLSDLLLETDDSALRKDLLRGLFDIYRWDIDAGGFGIGDPAYRAIMDHTTPEERHQVADWVRNALPGDAADDEEKTFDLMSGSFIRFDPSSWKRKRLGRFLLDLEGDRLDDETYLQICRETGQLDALVGRLLGLDRLDEALEALRNASDDDLYRLADRFVEYSAATEIRDLVQERVETSQDPDTRLIQWLRDYVATHDDHEAALTLSKRLFWTSRSPDAYRSIRTHAQALDRWTEERMVILDRLREAEQFDLLTRLHLAEDNVGAALRTVHQTGGGWYGSTQGLKLEVARAAEVPHPERAIELYLEVAGDLIDQRGRKNYAQAAEHLARIKQIYIHQGDMNRWSELIDTLREEYSNLPALQDELDKAGL